MKCIPPDILVGLENALKQRDIPLASWSAYRKWVIYFMDFRAKYPVPAERSDQVRLFSEKLRSKGQSEAQVAQAADAVSLFFASRQKSQAVASVPRHDAIPTAAIRSLPEKPPEHLASDGRHARMICEPPGPPAHSGCSQRHRRQYDEWRCLRISEYPSWDAIIGLLADEIKARHYLSSKVKEHGASILKVYA